MKPLPLFVALFALAVLADPAAAQRRRNPGRRGGPGGPTAAPPSESPSAPATRKKVEKWTAIKDGDVYLGTGEMLRRATVLIGDDHIEAVGTDLEIPKEATVIDARGKCVSPGFIAVQGSGMGAGGATSGGKYADSVNAFDPMMGLALAAGITSFCTWSGGGPNISGTSAVMKLTPHDVDHMVLKEPAVYALTVPLQPTDMKNLRELVGKARDWVKEHEAWTAHKAANPTQAGEEPKKPNGADPVIAVLKGEVRLIVNAGGGGRGGMFGGGAGGFDVNAIREAMEISRLLDKGVVLWDPTEAWVVPEEVSATNSMTVLMPRARVRPNDELNRPNGSNIAAAAILEAAGVPVAVLPPGGMFGGATVGTGGILGRDLNTLHVDAAFAVRGGLDNRKALRTITLDAAEVLGVADRIGSLEAGKDADVLILDGDPLHYRTFVETAFVNGKVVYEKDKATFYSHIHR